MARRSKRLTVLIDSPAPRAACRGASNFEFALKPTCFHVSAIVCNEAFGSQRSIVDTIGKNPLVSTISLRGRKLADSLLAAVEDRDEVLDCRAVAAWP